MKKVLLLSLVLLCSFATSVSARGPHDRPHGRDGHGQVAGEHREDRERIHAREVLKQTNVTLERAQQSARRGGYRDGLGRAFAHQDEAMEQFRRGRYERAISHSMRARETAEDIIQVNRRHDRRRYHHDYDRHDDLDSSISVRIHDDKAALRIRLKFD